MAEKQTILVTGATGNVGGGAAVALAKRGANLVLFGRKSERLEAKADSIRASLSEAGIESDAGIDMVTVEFSDMESIRQTAAEVLKRFPAINGLIISFAELNQNGPKILSNGHEIMFATNVMGPFLFTHLLLERLIQSYGLILHVIAPFYKEIDWDDIESIRNHKTTAAYNRTKTFERMISAELARRYAGKISSVAFNPTSPPCFIMDKTDPEMKNKLPSGFLGFFWRMMTAFFAMPPVVAGEPIADLMLLHNDRKTINGALFKLSKRIEKPDKMMNDEASCKRLWDELIRMTGLAHEKNPADC